MAARYLVRFDDVCPGMNWGAFDEVERILDAHRVKPMLAVVPANVDPGLNVHAPSEAFWERVRGWQAKGWAIGLHGYQHRYVTADAGIVGINARSEFAGLPAAEQEDKLRRGLAIFAGEGVRADVWIAPAHSFDRTTLEILRRLGVDAVSDGFFLSPHRDRDGMLWVPQQLWGFKPRAFGVWTVCNHVNDWGAGELRRFEADIAAYAPRITSLREIAAAPVRGKALGDHVAAALLLRYHRAKRWVRGRGWYRERPIPG